VTGVYFAALVTYAAVFHVSPVGAAAPPEVEPATAAALQASTAAALQAIAWEFVRDYYTSEGVGVRTMEECRTGISGSVCATFWGLLDQPGNVGGCQSYFDDTDSNPFKWPDPDLQPWPAP
jgi:hypothetical protein